MEWFFEVNDRLVHGSSSIYNNRKRVFLVVNHIKTCMTHRDDTRKPRQCYVLRPILPKPSAIGIHYSKKIVEELLILEEDKPKEIDTSRED